MKKISIYIIAIVLIFGIGTAVTFAEGQTTDTTVPASTPSLSPTSSPSPAPTPAPTQTTVQAGITPDSILYPLEKMIESVQVALTFTPEGKAELLVSFANERLAEAQIMTEQNKQTLVLKVMDAYIKTINDANENAEEAAQDQKNVTPILDDITITEQTAGTIVIKATGVIPQDAAEQLKAAVTDQVKSTIAVQAFSTAKSAFSVAKGEARQAAEKLKLAQKAGSETLVKAAADELQKAEQKKDQAESLKNQVEAYKNVITDGIKDQGKKAQIIEKQQAKRQEIADKKAQITERQQAKRQEIEGKNAEKQLEKQLKTAEELDKRSGNEDEDKDENDQDEQDKTEHDD